jgi:D-3-phosphoglycerate dehydrogenase / 2-oxoglutarate reductase
MKNVLLLETIADEAFEILHSNAEIQIFEVYKSSLEEILQENKIDVIITRGKGQVRKELMEAIPTLKIVARCGVGLDNIDIEEASARKIKVVNAPGSNADTIAEHTISLMLILQRNLFQSISEVKNGNWNWRNQFQGDEINGKTLGILGLGNIGKKVANIANAMGMKVIYWNDSKQDVAYKFCSFEEVLKQSDIISLHLPLTNQTENLINEVAFSQMKPNAILINTARGQIIDEKALLNALEANKIAGFGADVLSIEPPNEENLLVNHPKTMITAHVGSLSATTYKKMCVSTVQNVVGILFDTNFEEKSIFNRNDL